MIRFTGLSKFLVMGMLTIVCIAQAPLSGHTEESSTKSDPVLIPQLQLMKEEETVSIASRYEQPISQAPANVYVITDEDIRHSGATDIPTVLRRIPGLEVMQTTGADFNVSARGNNQLGSNKMLVMVDGRSIYFDVQGQMFWKVLPVTLPEIKRIEVLKGPASVIYGFNAFDGIINIITKSPQEMKGTALQFGGGELGTISSAAIHAGTAGNFGYRLSAGRDQNQQWRNRDSLAFRSHKVNALTEYSLPDSSKLFLSGGLVHSNRLDGQLVDVLTPNNNLSTGYAYAGYERTNFFVRGFWNGWSSDFDAAVNPIISNLLRVAAPDGTTTWAARANTYNLETQHTLEVGAANRLSYGVNYRHNTLTCNCIVHGGHENRLGIYIQDEWQMMSQLRVVAGARYDLDSFINPTLSPRLALLYQPASNHTFRTSVSMAYRPPTMIETLSDIRGITNLPLPPPFNSTTTSSVGSQNLSPERIISYEAGYQGWFLNHRLRIRADLFYNHITNLVAGGSLQIGPNAITSVNATGQADIYGGEAGIEFLATSWLSGFANYSYQEINQAFSQDPQNSAQRASPRFKFNVGLRGDWENGISSEATFHHYGSVTYPAADDFAALSQFGAPQINPRVGSYNLLNLRVAYKFWHEMAEAGYMRDAEFAISAFNALNDKHNEHPLGDTIGSRVMGWLTVRY
jgi:iron complex outermembrane receptor protein